MSGLTAICDLADREGWWLLEQSEDLRRSVFFKWSGDVRMELCVLADRAGRIEAASLWHNRRHDIRQQPGVRQYAERVLREATS